jgi:LPXTG-motif cell wall-anchored protein
MHNQSRRHPLASRVLGALAVTATAALATLALATPASAHTPTWDASCDENGKVTKVWVKLTRYVDKGKNTVVVKDVVNGVEKELPVDNKGEFATSFYKEWKDLDATVKHDFKLVVKTWDGFNFEDKKTVQPCVKTPPPATTTKPVKQVTTTTEAPSSSATSSTPTAPAPGGSTPEPPLAATGASPMWLLLSGLGLVGAGAGTLLLLRRRRSA